MRRGLAVAWIRRGLAKTKLSQDAGGRTKRPRVVKRSQPSCPPAPMTKYRAKLSGQRARVPATKIDAVGSAFAGMHSARMRPASMRSASMRSAGSRFPRLISATVPSPARSPHYVRMSARGATYSCHAPATICTAGSKCDGWWGFTYQKTRYGTQREATDGRVRLRLA